MILSLFKWFKWFFSSESTTPSRVRGGYRLPPSPPPENVFIINGGINPIPTGKRPPPPSPTKPNDKFPSSWFSSSNKCCSRETLHLISTKDKSSKSFRICCRKCNETLYLKSLDVDSAKRELKKLIERIERGDFK